MAFIFSTSHLPETRARRPDHLEEEEDEDTLQQPPPRAGGVRAFSHLPEPVRAQVDFEGPLSTRPATPVGRPRPYADPEADVATDEDRDTDHVPGPDSDHDDVARAHEYEDDTPWHQPRITARAQPPLDYPEDAHALAPDSSTREAPAQDNSPAMLRGRIFEKRLPPGLQGQSSGQSLRLASMPSMSRPDESRSHLADHAQSVADTRGATPQPKGLSPAPSTTGSMPGPHGAASPAPGATQRPSVPPAESAPSSPQPTAPGATKEVPVPLKIDAGDEASVDVRGRKFGDSVRSVMRAELAGSPMAAALLKRAVELSGKQVVIKMIPYDPKRKDQKEQEAWSEIGPDGTIIIHISPTNLKSGTLSHEVSHAIQGWHLEAAKKDKMTKSGTDALSEGEINNAIRAGRAELNKVVKVRAEEDDLSHPADYKENEAVRAANIVTAELTAAEIKAELEAHPVSDPKIIADMFWKKQTALREASGHETNTPRPLPIGTKYGHYDFARVLELLGNNVTLDHLIQWRFEHLGGN